MDGCNIFRQVLYVAALPCKVLEEFKFAAYLEENANRMQWFYMHQI